MLAHLNATNPVQLLAITIGGISAKSLVARSQIFLFPPLGCEEPLPRPGICLIWMICDVKPSYYGEDPGNYPMKPGVVISQNCPDQRKHSQY
jgi:hypothetical protein